MIGMAPKHIDSVVALQRACFPPPFPKSSLWRSEHLRRHLEVFPAGQLVAVQDGRVVASASAAIIDEDTWQAHLGWEETLGGFEFNHHDPGGTTLYGADISVHPDHRGKGVGRALYKRRFEIVREIGLARFGTACRMPDFRGSGRALHEYVLAVLSGAANDRTLTPLLRCGLNLLGVIEEYMPDDESGNAAALLEWRP